MLSTSRREPVASLAPSEWFTNSKGKAVNLVTPIFKTVKVKVPISALASSSSLPYPRSRGASIATMNATTKAKSYRSAPTSTASSSSLSSLSSLSSSDETKPPTAPVTKKRKQVDASFASASKAARTSADAGREEKTRRVVSRARVVHDATPRPRKNNNTLAPKELVYRKSGSRSRSTTAFEMENAPPLEHKTWTDEDGCVAGQVRSSKDVVKALTDVGRYRTEFRNPEDMNDATFELYPLGFPTVRLEYPNDGAVEEYLLYAPKDKDHYNPIICLELSLYTIIRDLVPPEHRAAFGTLPEETLRNAGTPVLEASPFSSSLTSLSSSPTSSSPATSSGSEFASPSRRLSPVTSTDLLRNLRRAKNRRDGPLFIKTVNEISDLLRSLKCDNSSVNLLQQAPHAWSKTGIPQGVVLRIIEETYQRCIGPHIDKLKKYSAFSSQVYGELMPSFVSDIIEQTGLRPDSLFVDLGSGVGNVVLQAALQSGCKAFGVELMAGPAKLAEDQREQMRLRCRMWGISMGEVELVQADMNACPRVDELMSKADVVLVNNFVFREELNAALRPKFLDLKEGAIVVSLKPFAPPSNQRLTERNIDDIAAIFDVSSRPYHTGTVSWSSGSGNYYIHRVDREGYRDCRARYEQVQARMERRREPQLRTYIALARIPCLLSLPGDSSHLILKDWSTAATSAK
ncbi:hypothetical protein EW145_g707 [Phellinidium pouzarii]|uniref:Histone-lysine N-methyltransferase, H3 lysine-79 specific n=1 Tax=Phellinidium pouzarii TaxID=167371 RepID=A0A4S4LHA9_9AGAM|nr:hypothetical protein EW145_g707 [Phellinidium pouzarii]